MTRFLASAAIVSLVAACSPADAPTPRAVESGPVLSYTDAFVMEPISGRDITMGGVTVSVDGGDVTLTSASSTSIDTIELHTMATVDGKMQMRQVEGFEIADGSNLELQRGGLDVQTVEHATDGVVGVDPAQNDVGIGHRGPVVATAIGDGPWI